jgi:hypothetical protein
MLDKSKSFSVAMDTETQDKTFRFPSPSDFKSCEATTHLMQSTTNTARINKAIESLEAGKGSEKALIERS